MKDTLSKLYRLQVLADQLMTTHKQADELRKLRDLNESDYQSLLRLLNQQQEGLLETLKLKDTVYREMYNGCFEVSRIKKIQSRQTNKIDFRSEVQLDKQLTKYHNTLSVKFKELNQLLWQLGEPLHHPTYLQAHLIGSLEIYNLLEIERDLQLSFAGYDLSQKVRRSDEETIEAYLQELCRKASALVKKMGGAVRYNTFLGIGEADCARLVDEGCANLIKEDQKLLESKLTPVEEKRVLRDKLQRIQLYFEKSARSYNKLPNGEARPKNYDEILLEAAELSYDDMKAKLKPLLPFSVDGRPEENEGVLTDQFDLDYAINHQGFLQVFQEKYDRLSNLRLKMNRVEELQERELRTEEAKVADKNSMSQKIEDELKSNPQTRRQYNKYKDISKKRDLLAVAFVKRPPQKLDEPFKYDEEFFCSGCHVVISKGLHQAVRKLEDTQTCDSCNRILVPFAHVKHIKEEVDPLLVSEEERIAMEERGEIGFIPACSNCDRELYEDKEEKLELHVAHDCSTTCPHCYSYLVALTLEEATSVNGG